MGAVEGKKLESHTCPLCGELTTKRLTTLTKHFFEVHNKKDEEVWEMENGPRPTCACGCGGHTTWRGWGKGYGKVVNGHNASIYAVYSPEDAAKISALRSASLTGRESWSKGHTKESDERIAARAAATSAGRKEAFSEGRIKTWNKGLTAESDERVLRASEDLKKKFSEGEIVPWAKGLSKDTDERVSKMAASVRIAVQHKSLRDRLDQIKRLSMDEVKQRIESSGDLTVVDGLQNYISDASRVIIVKCNRCGTHTQGSLRMLGKGRCFQCAPGGSAAQEEVARYVESLGVEVKRNDRKTMAMELDIYVPRVEFAIEYNGLFWHSHINKPPQYHENKSRLAKECGIKLLHVFEDEWRDKKNIVKSLISSRLGISSLTLGARKCKVKILTASERKSFFEENHLDGDVASEVAWGLVSNGEIVYALSLRRPFHKKYSSGLEISRCCPRLGHNVQGGLSKLVKIAREYCKTSGKTCLMTYVDTRLGGQGRGYEISGLKRSGSTVARWWWTDMDNRFNRFKFKANSEEGKSEAEVASEAGVVKIWGCENVVYTLDV